MYFKRTRRPVFRTPSAVAGLLLLGNRVGNRVRGVEKVDAKPEGADEVKVICKVTSEALGGCRGGTRPRKKKGLPSSEVGLNQQHVHVRGCLRSKEEESKGQRLVLLFLSLRPAPSSSFT